MEKCMNPKFWHVTSQSLSLQPRTSHAPVYPIPALFSSSHNLSQSPVSWVQPVCGVPRLCMFSLIHLWAAYSCFSPSTLSNSLPPWSHHVAECAHEGFKARGKGIFLSRCHEQKKIVCALVEMFIFLACILSSRAKAVEKHHCVFATGFAALSRSLLYL